MKVYIVTSGTYSDYQIDAVFSTEDKAKAYLDKHGNYDNRQIEEYDTDIEDTNRETAIYSVHIDSKRIEVRRDDFHSMPDTIRAYESYCGSGLGYTLTVETDGAERAKKIASERLAQVKAMPYLFPRLNERCEGYRLYSSIVWNYPTYNYHTKEIILDKDYFLKDETV